MLSSNRLDCEEKVFTNCTATHFFNISNSIIHIINLRVTRWLIWILTFEELWSICKQRTHSREFERKIMRRPQWRGWLSPGLGFPRTKPDCCCWVSVICVARCAGYCNVTADLFRTHAAQTETESSLNLRRGQWTCPGCTPAPGHAGGLMFSQTRRCTFLSGSDNTALVKWWRADRCWKLLFM